MKVVRLHFSADIVLSYLILKRIVSIITAVLLDVNGGTMIFYGSHSEVCEILSKLVRK
jgi:hypothetical protein